MSGSRMDDIQGNNRDFVDLIFGFTVGESTLGTCITLTYFDFPKSVNPLCFEVCFGKLVEYPSYPSVKF